VLFSEWQENLLALCVEVGYVDLFEDMWLKFGLVLLANWHHCRRFISASCINGHIDVVSWCFNKFLSNQVIPAYYTASEAAEDNISCIKLCLEHSGVLVLEFVSSF